MEDIFKNGNKAMSKLLLEFAIAPLKEDESYSTGICEINSPDGEIQVQLRIVKMDSALAMGEDDVRKEVATEVCE